MAAKEKTNWGAMRKAYIVERLAGNIEKVPRFTFKEFADTHKLDYTEVRRHAAAEKWEAEYQSIIDKTDKEQLTLLRNTLQKHVDAVSDTFLSEEVSIRKRHISFARQMQQIGMMSLLSKDPRKISTADAALLVKIGVAEERLAAGLPDQISEHLITMPGAKPGVTPRDRVLLQQKFERLGAEFARFIEGDYKLIPE